MGFATRRRCAGTKAVTAHLGKAGSADCSDCHRICRAEYVGNKPEVTLRFPPKVTRLASLKLWLWRGFHLGLWGVSSMRLSTSSTGIGLGCVALCIMIFYSNGFANLYKAFGSLMNFPASKVRTFFATKRVKSFLLVAHVRPVTLCASDT